MIRHAMTAALALLLGACAAGAGSSSGKADAPASAADAVDRTCRTDADCVVKNVGNCCGYFPACVNVDSPTFPERAQAECAQQGRAGVCGFVDIAACACVEGRCEAADGAGAQPVR